MKITPKVSLLKSLRAERFNLLVLLGEAVDNSFDAHATCVEIRVGDRMLSFRDNGFGLNKERLEALFTLGDHVPTGSRTPLGRFGIGITAQAVSAGNIIEIDSISNQGRCLLRADWREVLRSGEWEVPDPDWMPFIVGTPTYTRIELSELREPEPYTSHRMFDDLAEYFHHAIEDGKQIIVNSQPVQCTPDPPLANIIERDLILSGGLGIKLRAGILLERSRRCRVYVGYRHRVLKARCTWGCSDYVGLDKMFCRLRLTGPWRLAKFKDDLTDKNERDELEAAVEAALQPILEKVNDAALDARVDTLGEIINEMVPPQLAAARPHRKKKGEREIVSESRKRKQNNEAKHASDDGKGPAQTKRSQRGRLMITFEGQNDVDGIGNYQSGRPDRVNLSRDNTIIGRIIDHRDQQLAASALYVIALLIYESRNFRTDLFDKSPGKRVAELLALNVGALPQETTETS